MFAPWALELSIITAKDLGVNIPGVKWANGQAHRIGGLPAPGDYLATFLIFAPLAFLADTSAHELAEVIAWGYVLASLLSLIDPTNPIGSTASTATSATGGATSGS
jgi:hypothetical protein